MPKFVVERHIPGIGSEGEMQAVAKRYKAVVEQLGDEIRWLVSFVTDDMMYCVFSAPNTDLIRLHSLRTGLPADQITIVRDIVSPATVD